MDVTTQNFGDSMEIITRLLPRAIYITYDLQFTGLHYQRFERDHINYLPFEKYQKLKYVAETYQLLQLGLSIVTFDGKLKVYPFNFYLFPRNPLQGNKNLTMQLSCVKFNTQHGMNWNKWIQQGINYIKLSQMSLIQEQIKSRSYRDILENLSVEQEEIADQFIRKLSEIDKQKLNSKFVFQWPNHIFMQRTLSNIFYRYTEEKKLCLTLTEGEESLTIERVSEEERKKMLQKRQEEIFGFSLIFQEIWKRKIPFVGHNCNLDLLYIYHNLVAPLPDSYFEYKKALRESGNSFYDTKYIALKYPEMSTAGTRLEDLVKHIRSTQKNIMDLSIDAAFSRYSLDKQVLHQAGYDSYLTAWVYQQSMKMKDKLSEQCKNKLNLLNSFYYIDLSEDEDEINPYFSANILRINVPLDEKEEVRAKRTEMVKMIKKGLQDMRQSFSVYEGYRQIFIEIKSQRRKIIQRIFLMIEKKQLEEVNTFASYLQWQKERALREEKINSRRGKREEDSSSSEPSKNKWIKKEK